MPEVNDPVVVQEYTVENALLGRCLLSTKRPGIYSTPFKPVANRTRNKMSQKHPFHEYKVIPCSIPIK